MITGLLLTIIYIAFISLGLPDSILGSAWPVIYRDLGVPVDYAGMIFMVVAAGTVVSSFLGGKLINRLGTGPITFISVLMTALALLGMSAGGDFWVFPLLAVPLGLGAGSVDVALNNYVALHFAAKHMNWLHCFWGVGATAGPMIMSLFLNAEKSGSNWRTGYRIIGLAQLTLAAVLLVSLPLWKKAAAAGEQAEAAKIAVKTSEAIRLPGVKSALITFFCYCGIEATVGLWGSSFLVIMKGLPAEAGARGAACFYTGITVGRFLSGFLTMKLNNRKMVRLGGGLLAAGLLCLLLPLGGTALAAGLFLVGIGCAPIFPCLLHETPVNFGSRYSQTLMGIQMACAYMGNIVVPPLFGFLAARISYGLFPVYLVGLLILMAVMVEMTVRRVAKRREI